MKSKMYFPKTDGTRCLEKCQAKEKESDIKIGSWHCQKHCEHRLQEGTYLHREWIACKVLRKARGKTIKQIALSWIERHPAISAFLAIFLTIAAFNVAMLIVDLIFLR